ncbi:hypothetical protein C0993_012081, partial [Termitomyces sp. T159_Od127]
MPPTTTIKLPPTNKLITTGTKLPENPEPQQQSRTSGNYIVFESSDDVLFHIHRKNLEVHAAGGPPPQIITSNGEIVSLHEDASTLENLFPYIYPLRYPDIDILQFQDLSKLAEAAEKYEIYSVMHVCKLRM